MKYLLMVMLVTVVFPMVSACASATTTSVTPVPNAAISSGAKPVAQGEWEKTLDMAKKEGRVSVVSSLGDSVRTPLSAAFKEKYGVETESLAGRGGENVAKIAAEQRAGLYSFDVIMGGASALVELPGSALEPTEPAFILPEVKNVSAWRDNKFPFSDKDKKIFMYLGRVGVSMLINQDLVKLEEVRSWRNLLEPKWKGKMLLEDPSVVGAGNALLTAIGELVGIDFLRELAKQEPIINRDKRLQVEWVARGKYPIALGYNAEIMEEFRGGGAPVAPFVPKEGTYFGSGVGSIAILSRPPHPNAAALFVNWFLSREGQTLFCKVAVDQSNRVDIIPVLPPDRLPQEGVKYFYDDTEYGLKKKDEMYKLSKEIFAAQYR